MPKMSDMPAVWSERHPATATLPMVQAASEVLPRVSVVIPTRGRPELAERAVRSVLAQSFEDFEMVVVVDGPDQETVDALRRFRDDRLHIVHLDENVGGSEARNIGVRFARSEWIALLDDDDEWYPDKLEKQWALAISMTGKYAFVGSQFLERTKDAERVLPGRMPEKGEAFSEYLFARRGWRSGEGFLQTSTWFVSRDSHAQGAVYAGPEALPGPRLAAARDRAARVRNACGAGSSGSLPSRREPNSGESLARLEISVFVGVG